MSRTCVLATVLAVAEEELLERAVDLEAHRTTQARAGRQSDYRSLFGWRFPALKRDVLDRIPGIVNADEHQQQSNPSHHEQ